MDTTWLQRPGFLGNQPSQCILQCRILNFRVQLGWWIQISSNRRHISKWECAAKRSCLDSKPSWGNKMTANPLKCWTFHTHCHFGMHCVLGKSGQLLWTVPLCDRRVELHPSVMRLLASLSFPLPQPCLFPNQRVYVSTCYCNLLAKPLNTLLDQYHCLTVLASEEDICHDLLRIAQNRDPPSSFWLPGIEWGLTACSGPPTPSLLWSPNPCLEKSSRLVRRWPDRRSRSSRTCCPAHIGLQPSVSVSIHPLPWSPFC